MTEQKLTEIQEAALRRELDINEFNRVAPSMWGMGIFGFDPLAEAAGRPTGWGLTQKGREIAIDLRREKLPCAQDNCTRPGTIPTEVSATSIKGGPSQPVTVMMCGECAYEFSSSVVLGSGIAGEG